MIDIEKSQREFMASCCNHDCNEGRKCPNKMPVQFVGDEPYATTTFVIAIVLVFVIISGAFLFAR